MWFQEWCVHFWIRDTKNKNIFSQYLSSLRREHDIPCMNNNDTKNSKLDSDKRSSLWWINVVWPKPHVYSLGLIFTDVQSERIKHHNVCQSVYETSPCVSKHCMKHGHMCLVLCATCPCVLSLHETCPCVPLIKWNMSTYAIITWYIFHCMLSRLLSLSLLSHLCMVYTLMYLKQIIFLGYRVLQLFCIYTLCYM